MIVYIAGPMTGLPDFNRAAFHSASDFLIKSDQTVLNPASLPDGLAERDYMAIGLSMLNAADCIYLLRGWEKSAGARTELALAEKLGLLIIKQGE
uniref:DUF4406 domain-containing protein n=1 Tax=Salmonella enterica TaxID=28901 RepID=UPI003A94B0BD